MHDQHLRMLLQIAEARRMHGTSERDGTIHEVWRQGNEQKVRLNIGQRPDGSPWLSPWLKVEDHHGSLREQQKFHKGQNVKMTMAGADFSQAKVTPSGENNAHPEPQHANDYHETSQYASMRVRTGPDFEERWLDSGGQVQGGSSGGQSSQQDKDPDKLSTVLTRWGAKPQDQDDKMQPWEGPDPNQSDPKKRHLKWAGEKGNTPTQNGDAIVTQFDKNVKTETTKSTILHKVQSDDGQQMPIPDTGDGTAQRTTSDNMQDADVLRKILDQASGKTTSTHHKNGDITHIVQDAMGNVSRITQQMNQIIHQMQGADGSFSTILQQGQKIFHQVTDSSGTSMLQITGSAITMVSKSINMNTESFSAPSLPPLQPAVSPSGDAPLIVIPQQWSIAAGLTPLTNIPGQWSIQSSLSVAAGFVATPSDWALGSQLAIASGLASNPLMRLTIGSHMGVTVGWVANSDDWFLGTQLSVSAHLKA
jgi:hypothetical protein